MENMPNRKAVRLAEYDYSQNGFYFVTVCARDKRPIFWETTCRKLCADDDGRLIAAPTEATHIIGRGGYQPPETGIIRPHNHPPETPPIRLSACGKIVDRAIQNIPSIYSDISVDTYVIMPDHIHMILVISGSTLPQQGTPPPNLMRVVGQMKRWASKQVGAPIWQKSFYEHVIRNYNDYIHTVEYIMNNPQKWMMQL